MSGSDFSGLDANQTEQLLKMEQAEGPSEGHDDAVTALREHLANFGSEDINEGDLTDLDLAQATELLALEQAEESTPAREKAIEVLTRHIAQLKEQLN